MASDDRERQSDLINELLRRGYTRRDVLKGAAGVAGAVSLGSLLAACGSSGTTSSASPSAAAPSPKKGGHLKVGTGGGTPKDNLDPMNAVQETQIIIQFQLYESLLGWDNEAKLVNLLAESYEASPDAKEHTVRLKSGLTFHDGKSVTADDVRYSFKRILDPKVAAEGAAGFAGMTMNDIKKVDDLTVKFVLDKPNAVFYEQLAYYENAIIPEGYDPASVTSANGTGPWKLKSYTPGQQIDFDANPNYWGEGPYCDQLTFIEFQDPTAKLNALLGGTVDYATILDAAQVSQVKSTSGFKLVEAKTGGWDPITMRVDKKPFNDVRVRKAMRLIMDRQQVIDQAYGGFATMGNDVFAPFDPGYPKDLPQRAQDIEQAKSLLKQAGYENDLTVELNCSTASGPNDPQASQVFAEQAKAAGVTIKLKKWDPSAFWNDYLVYPFAWTFWGTRNYLAQCARCMIPGAPYVGETAWNDPAWEKLYKEAVQTVDEAKRNELVSEMARMDYDQGGYLIHEFHLMVDGYSDKLGAVLPDTWGAEAGNRGRFNLVYFA
jgi:peptide/nickel transport system substrate-binding protein